MVQVAAYDTVEKKMAFFDPSRAKDFLFISGTKVRLEFLFLHPHERKYGKRKREITY